MIAHASSTAVVHHDGSNSAQLGFPPQNAAATKPLFLRHQESTFHTRDTSTAGVKMK